MATMSARYTVIDGEVVAQERGGVRHQLVPDPLGSTVALYDDSGTKTDTFSYWPYGESASRAGETTVKFQYVGSVGYYNDSNSRKYIRARYLNTNIGRWITEDEVGFEYIGGNIYQYAYIAPVLFIDKSGFQPQQHPMPVPTPTPPPGFRPPIPVYPKPQPGPKPTHPIEICGPFQLSPSIPWAWWHPCNWDPVPTWPLVIHGNYCGTCASGGYGFHIDPIPADQLDAACQLHDKCLGSPGKFFNPYNHYKCNMDLCKEATKCMKGLCSDCDRKCRFDATQVANWICNSLFF